MTTGPPASRPHHHHRVPARLRELSHGPFPGKRSDFAFGDAVARNVGALISYVLLQARKPNKWIGRIFARAMNKGHDSTGDWGLRFVTIESRFTILDVGGGGRMIEKLAAIAAGGTVYKVRSGDVE